MDLIAQGRLGPEEPMKITCREAQQLAIAEGDDIGVPPVGDEQSEFPEEIAAPELYRRRQYAHLHRARREEIHRVPALASADDDLVGYGKTRAQHAGERAPRLRVE